MDRKEKITIALTGNLLTDQRMQRISAALAESGRGVELYYRNHYKYDKGRKPAYTAPEGILSIALDTPFSKGPAFYLYYNLLLLMRLLFRKTDALYAVDADTLPAMLLLSLLKRKKLIYDAHEFFSEVPELEDSRIKKKIWELITAAGVKRACLCLTVSESLAEELKRKFGKPFAAIRNVPAYDPRPAPPETNQKPLILYQGALNKGRMLEMLINAMRRMPEFRCIIAGEGDLSLMLRHMAAGADNIEFAGLLSPAELKALTPQAFAGFNLLDASGSKSYYFSLSNKYFDYMHAGVPSVSSALPEYLKLNARWGCGVCIEERPEALIYLLRNWKNHPEIYLKLKENAKFAAESENWEREKQTFIKLIRL